MVNHLLSPGIIHIALDGSIVLKPVDDHSIHQDRRLRRAGAMNVEVGLLHRTRTADIGCVHLNSDDELSCRLDGVSRGHSVQHVARKDLGLEICLRVDDRRFRGDSDGLFNRADRHLGIDCCREVGGQLHLTRDGLETRKSERQAVVTWTQIDDLVRAAFIRDG